LILRSSAGQTVTAFLLNETELEYNVWDETDSSEGTMDLKDIKAIIDLMKKNSISEFELERQEFKIRLKRSNGAGTIGDDGGAVQYLAQPVVAQMTPAQSAALPPPPSAASNEIEIKSPMVGTFYRAPSPEAANYIEIGSEVGPDSVVCIIEAMKVMNEIKAEVRGVITQVMVENARPVEFGQPLFKIRPL
jgi:acetyl-CoA carboxylase biotin carboxyl carrier protein